MALDLSLILTVSLRRRSLLHVRRNVRAAIDPRVLLPRLPEIIDPHTSRLLDAVGHRHLLRHRKHAYHDLPMHASELLLGELGGRNDGDVYRHQSVLLGSCCY